MPRSPFTRTKLQNKAGELWAQNRNLRALHGSQKQLLKSLREAYGIDKPLPKRIRRVPMRYSSSDSGPVRKETFVLGGMNQVGLNPGEHFIKRVTIQYQGSRGGDFAVANAQVGYQNTPAGYVWHHFHDYSPSPAGNAGYGTMYLMLIPDHQSIHHSGGVRQYEVAHGLPPGGYG